MTETRKVQYTVWKNVTEEHDKTVPYTVCKMVPQTITKTVPYTVCEMVPTTNPDSAKQTPEAHTRTPRETSVTVTTTEVSTGHMN